MSKSSNPFKLAVIVSGNGSNLQAILDAQKNGVLTSKTVVVISNKADAYALQRAKKAKIPTCVITSAQKTKTMFEQELIDTLSLYQPNLIVLAGFMKILSPHFVKHFAHQIINIHPSLLPSFKGLNAQQQALDAGVKIAGCTVHLVDEGCDTGPILIQKAVTVKKNETLESLTKKIHKIEHISLIHAIKLFENNKACVQTHKTLINKGL